MFHSYASFAARSHEQRYRAAADSGTNQRGEPSRRTHYPFSPWFLYPDEDILVREQQPDLLVVDCDLLEEEVLALLRQVKEEWPRVRCLALTRTSRQRARADAVLPRDGPIRELNLAVGKV